MGLKYDETHQTAFTLRKNALQSLTGDPGLQPPQQVKSNHKTRHVSKRICLSHPHEDPTDENILHQILVNMSTILGSSHFENVEDLKHAIL